MQVTLLWISKAEIERNVDSSNEIKTLLNKNVTGSFIHVSSYLKFFNRFAHFGKSNASFLSQ